MGALKLFDIYNNTVFADSHILAGPDKLVRSPKLTDIWKKEVMESLVWNKSFNKEIQLFRYKGFSLKHLNN